MTLATESRPNEPQTSGLSLNDSSGVRMAAGEKDCSGVKGGGGKDCSGVKGGGEGL